MPGPGQYGNPILKENLGGKFNLSNPKSDVDWMVRSTFPFAHFCGNLPILVSFFALHISLIDIASRCGEATSYLPPANTAIPVKKKD
jgi:hypothetical protein